MLDSPEKFLWPDVRTSEGRKLAHGKVSMARASEVHEKKGGWQAADVIEIYGLMNCTDMNGARGLLEKYDAKSGKWVAHVYLSDDALYRRLTVEKGMACHKEGDFNIAIFRA